MISLVLGDVAATAGEFAQPPAAPSDSTVGVGGRPSVVLFAGIALGGKKTGDDDHARFGFGASDGTHSGASAFTDSSNVSPSEVWGYDDDSAPFATMGNDAGLVDGRASAVAFDAGSFAVTWSQVSGSSDQIFYLALSERVGIDGGLPDSGTADGGAPDGGPSGPSNPSVLAIGCDCGASHAGLPFAVGLAILSLALRRRGGARHPWREETSVPSIEASTIAAAPIRAARLRELTGER